MQEQTKKTRYNLLDSLRGFALINMILYHACWDLVYIFNKPLHWFTSTPGEVWQFLICSSFILISGFCQVIARHSIKDGVIVSLAGLLITGMSFILGPSEIIIFGILTFIGFSILLTAFLKPILQKINPILLIVFSIICFILTKNIYLGTISFFGHTLFVLPSSLFTDNINYFLTFLGFPSFSFYSGDYFPVLPWYFMFLTGFSLGEIFKRYHLLDLLKTRKIRWLDFLGRHSLIIYLIHQPILYLLFSLLFR